MKKTNNNKTNSPPKKTTQKELTSKLKKTKLMPKAKANTNCFQKYSKLKSLDQ